MESDFQAIKEEIRARINIVDVIGQYTRLKQSGKNWTGLCPFHSDKKPSFSVSQQFSSYRCWSCGEKGDLFTFVQKKENLEFVEALEWLAKRAGITFERKSVNKEQASERQQMLELNQLAVHFFQDRLAKSQEARDLLAQRGVLKTTQDQWDIGYAPPDWDSLVYYLQQKRANLEVAVKMDLIKARKTEGSGYYDTYRNRLIFPIHDLNGSVVGFGGRAISKDEERKYLNSTEAPIFHKSEILYGLYFALKKKLSSDTSPVFVEGFMDVVTAHQAGFTQCVATLGTAMTEVHARKLVRYNPRVIICYDADRAGISATLKGAQIWESLGVEGAEVRVARLPAGDDPDSLLKRGETATFQTALDNAVPRIDFLLELALKRHDLETAEGRDAALAEAIPILATIERKSVRARYADRLIHLHPLHGRYGVDRTIAQILDDVETAARHMKQSPRMNGYPLTEAANREPLQNEPPPNFRAPNSEQWGGEWPHTREVIRKGEAPRPAQGEKTGWKDWKRGPRKTGPASDSTPPPLTAPVLTNAEKAERQLLRALFSGEWRVFVLDQLTPDLPVTPHGKRLLHWAACTPAGQDGGLDPLSLLNAVEAQEADNLQQGAGKDTVASASQDSAKFSDFIRELLEDSIFTVSNERLNEVALRDCVEILKKQRISRELQELTEQMQQATQEEMRTILPLYHEKIRAMRGSRNVLGESSAGDGAAGH